MNMEVKKRVLVICLLVGLGQYLTEGWSSGCSDRYSTCATWKTSGYCTTGVYVQWMKRNCAKTCRACSGDNVVGEISVDTLHNMIQQNKDVYLVDVRRRYELQQEGKIDQAVHIPLHQLKSALKLSNEAFQKKYKVNKPSKNNCNLVFYCRSGGRSLRAAHIAKNHGYKCPKSLKGGFSAWKRKYTKKSLK